jgi:hypothetical protein
MRTWSLSLLIAFLLSGHQASAQGSAITGAEITWFGIYTVAKPSESKAVQGPMVKESGIIPPTTNRDQIVLGRGLRFGFGYTLTGSPTNGRVEVTPVFKYPPPGVFEPAIGRTVDDVMIPFVECDIGGKDCLVGFVVGDAKGVPAGVWTFQLYDRKNLLAEKKFTVSLP